MKASAKSAITLACALTMAAGPVIAQQGDGTNVTITTHIFKPDKVPATKERIEGLSHPRGFAVSVFADGLLNPRILAVAPDGAVYVSRREQGDVLLLKDSDGDGKADGPAIAVANRPGAHGLAIHDGKLYLATVHELFFADIQADDTLGALTMLVGDLPDAGQHEDRTLAFGPDGMLYISTGSTCNACNEPNPENATILRANPDGSGRTIFASGLRNTIGFDWNPTTGELWGLDNGMDFLGDNEQPEELNRIELGKRYGWPHVYGNGDIYPQSTPPGGISKQQWKSMSTPMVLGYTAHAAPMQMLFYAGSNFPAEYRGDAFATMRGSWNRMPASGYEIVRYRFSNGQPTAVEPFVSGFLTDHGRTHFARPVGLAVARDGSLLMADDGNGVIYRIAFTGSAPATAPVATTKVPADAMLQQASRGTHVPLISERPEFAAAAALSVSSTAFASGGAMPLRTTSYAEGVSPSLRWSATPDARSYAIVTEDPDAKPAQPFVHWVAFNIPASVTALPEGVQTGDRLTDPAGVLQGRTTRGSVGYYGPHPPVGDPPHHYHFQVLALDRLLDVPPGASRDMVLEAARGHVLAKGEIVGTFAQATKPLK